MATSGDLIDDMLAVQASIAAAFGSIMEKDSSATTSAGTGTGTGTGEAAAPAADGEAEAGGDAATADSGDKAIKNAKAKSAPSPNALSSEADDNTGLNYDPFSENNAEGDGGATSSAWPAEGEEGETSMVPYGGEEVDMDDPLAAAIAKLNGVQDWSVKDSVLPLESIPEDLSFAHAYHMALKESYPDGYSVKVTGLEGEDNLSAEDLQKHFVLCGEVRRVVVKVDRSTGQRTGTAFVDFATSEAAEMAVALTGSEIAGHTVEVERAKGGQTFSIGKGYPKGKSGGKWGYGAAGGGGTQYAKGYGAAKGASEYGDFGDWSSDWGCKGKGKGKGKGKAGGGWGKWGGGWYPPGKGGKGWYPY